MSSHQMHDLGFHEGEVLFGIADTYKSVLLAAVECVQNGIDAGATRIFVGIDQLERRVAICDNGNGISVGQFRGALLSIGKSVKKAGSLGQFGRGLVAPVNKCKTMKIISQPKNPSNEGVNCWLFIGEQLREQEKNLSIPHSKLDEFPNLPQPFEHAANDMRRGRERAPQWRTMVLMDHVVNDRVIGAINLEELTYLIQNKLGRGMALKGTVVYIKLRNESGVIKQARLDPTKYTGQKLEPVVLDAGLECGEVKFELYKARLTGTQRIGTVMISPRDDLSGLTVKEFRAQATGLGFYNRNNPEIKAAFQALTSGFFEGIIEVENLQLDPDRKNFVGDDRAKALCLMIEQWYIDQGKALMNDERAKKEEQRYSDLGDKSLTRLQERIRSGDEDLAILGLMLQDALPPSRLSSGRKDRSERPLGKKAPTDDDKPKSQRRAYVRPKQPPKESPGSPVSPFFNYSYEVLPGSGRLWEYDPETYTLTFNIRHPQWVSISEGPDGESSKKHDDQVMHLQEWLTFMVMSVLVDIQSSGGNFEIARQQVDDMIHKGFIALFIKK